MVQVTETNRQPDIEGDTITAGGTQYVGTFQTESDLPDATNFDVGAEATVVSDPNGETSVYKLVDQ